jgi:hypothetical protein
MAALLAATVLLFLASASGAGIFLSNSNPVPQPSAVVAYGHCRFTFLTEKVQSNCFGRTL